MASFLAADAHAPVPTRVVQAVKLGVGCADHDDGVDVDIEREEVPGSGHLAGVAGEEPTPPPDPLRSSW